MSDFENGPILKTSWNREELKDLDPETITVSLRGRVWNAQGYIGEFELERRTLDDLLAHYAKLDLDVAERVSRLLAVLRGES